MKTIIIYLVITMAFAASLMLLFSGGILSVAGLLCFGVMYISGELFPALWAKYWRANVKILAWFGCL